MSRDNQGQSEGFSAYEKALLVRALLIGLTVLLLALWLIGGIWLFWRDHELWGLILQGPTVGAAVAFLGNRLIEKSRQMTVRSRLRSIVPFSLKARLHLNGRLHAR